MNLPYFPNQTILDGDLAGNFQELHTESGWRVWHFCSEGVGDREWGKDRIPGYSKCDGFLSDLVSRGARRIAAPRPEKDFRLLSVLAPASV